MDFGLETQNDKRVLNIAAEISEAKDKDIPRLLLQLKDVLDSASQGSRHLHQLKLDIWTYDLLQVLILALKQDFSRIAGEWDTAAKLVSILCHSCSGLDPPESEEFYETFLPDAAEKILTLVRKVQVKYIKTSSVLEERKQKLMDSFTSILDSLSLLMGGHESLTVNVLSSSYLLQMLMSDNAKTVLVVMGTIQAANRTKPGVIGAVGERVAQHILDELIYKLSASEDADLASGSTRTLLVICESHPDTVQLLCTRYRGLKPLLNKWQNKGFQRDLGKLILLLEAGSVKKAQLEALSRAARTIQAAWKSHTTRTTLKKANTAFGKLQRSFRSKLEEKERKKEEERWQAELHHMLVLSRRRAMRDLYTKRMEALKILPASEVNKYLEAEQVEAATKIQALWRGYHTRKSKIDRHTERQQKQAAITIQRKTRKYLAAKEAKKREPPAWQRPPGLSDERRVELLGKIMEWRETHPPETKSEEARRELHDRVQQMLKQHVISSQIIRKKEQSREALLARLDIDANLILSAPKLSDVTEKDVEAYTCHSVPIATKAKQNHTNELRLLKQPWWRKLGDEYQDEKLEEEIDWKVF